MRISEQMDGWVSGMSGWIVMEPMNEYMQPSWSTNSRGASLMCPWLPVWLGGSCMPPLHSTIFPSATWEDWIWWFCSPIQVWFPPGNLGPCFSLDFHIHMQFTGRLPRISSTGVPTLIRSTNPERPAWSLSSHLFSKSVNQVANLTSNFSSA